MYGVEICGNRGAGAVEVKKDTGAVLYFSGNVRISGNLENLTSGEGIEDTEKNVVLSNNNNTTVQTTEAGLSEHAYVGIYSIDGAGYYQTHGKRAQDFGTYAAGSGNHYLECFHNDRNGFWGEVDTDSSQKYIRWYGPLVKITDPQDRLLYYLDESGRLKAAVYSTLKSGFAAASKDFYYKNGDPYEAAPAQIKLKALDDLEMTAVETYAGPRDLILTTAETGLSQIPEGNGDTFLYKGEGKGSDGRAILKRAANTSLITVNTQRAFTAQNLNVYGAGGSFTGRCFQVTNASKTVFKDMTFTACRADYGGGIYHSTTGDLTVKNVTFGALKQEALNLERGALSKSHVDTGAACTGNGGAIYSTTRELLVENSCFYGCSGGTGGAIYLEGTNTEARVRFKDSLFLGCSATTNHGGAICEHYGDTKRYGEKTLMKECIFTDCSANSWSGACLLRTRLVEVADSSFTRCTGGSANCGAVSFLRAEEASFTRCAFADCHISGNGGALGNDREHGSANSLSVSGCTFTGCYCGFAGGGAIYARTGSLSLLGAEAPEEPVLAGSAKGLPSGTKIATSFQSCQGAWGGAVYTNATTLMLSDTRLESCQASSGGGGLYAEAGASLSLGEGVHFHSCSTGSSGQGGGLYAAGSLTLTGAEGASSSFESCSASQGGGVYCKGDSLMISAPSLLFKSCASTQAGGGLRKEGGVTLRLTGLTFEECRAGSGGGAVYANPSGEVAVTNCTFRACQHTCENGAGGGAALWKAGGGALKVKDTLVQGCISKATSGKSYYGGSAIYLEGGTLTLTGSEAKEGTPKMLITGCQAQKGGVVGGAINLSSGRTLYLEGDVKIWDNQNTAEDSAHPHNLVLDQNNATSIRTTEKGLGSSSRIGVYVTGTENTQPFQSRGGDGDDFGTYDRSTGGKGDENLSLLINDRDSRLYGEANLENTDHHIRWCSGPVCKLTDSEGLLLYLDSEGKRPAVFGSLLAGFSGAAATLYYRDGKSLSYEAGGSDNAPLQLKLLKDVAVTKSISCTVKRKLTLTSAEGEIPAEKAQIDGDTYCLQTGREVDAQRALITKEVAFSLFTFDTGDQVTIRDLIFDGNREKVTGNTSGGFISLNSGSLNVQGGTTMRNVSLGAGSTSRHGGAIYSNGEAPVSISCASGERIEFLNCQADNGGALFSWKSPVVLTNEGTLRFENCQARYGGAIHTNDAGGSFAVTNRGSVELKNCAASEVGGAFSAYRSSIGITNAAGSILFENCSAKSGGALYAAGEVSIAGEASSLEATTSLGTTTFLSCSATSGSGGGIYQGGGASLTLEGVTFGGYLTDEEGSYLNGEGEKTTDPLEYVPDPALSCSSSSYGGGFYSALTKTLTMDQCTFLGCKGSAGGGFYLERAGSYDQEVSVEHSTFTGCEARVFHGGAICQHYGSTSRYGKKTLLKECVFKDCIAKSWSGACLLRCKEVVAEDCEFTGCYGTADNCGALSLLTAEKARIERCLFEDCHVSGLGGAVGNHSQNGPMAEKITLAGCCFEDCYSDKGGAVYAWTKHLELTDSTVPQSPPGTGAAKGHGAGEKLETVFTACHAAYGGGVYLSGSNLLAKGALFGGYRMDEAGNLLDKDSLVTQERAHADLDLEKACHATYGGGLYLESALTLKGEGSLIFAGCQASGTSSGAGTGGGIYGANALTYEGEEGALFFLQGCSARMGGGIYSTGSDLSLSGGSISFKGCSSTLAGGGLRKEGGNTLTLLGVSFEECRAGSGGAAVYASPSGAVTVTECSFQSCSHTSENGDGGGAGIWKAGAGALKVTDSAFEACISRAGAGRAYYGGSAIYLENGSLTLTGSEVEEGERAKMLIIGCQAQGTTKLGGAINLSSGRSVTFEGDVQVWDNTNTSLEGDGQVNVVLEHTGSSDSYNTVIRTSKSGLGSRAHIGVYVTGEANSEPYKSHGKDGEDFGTYDSSQGGRGDENLQCFVNDRDGRLYGEANLDNSSHLLRWTSGPVCKLTDVNEDNEGVLLYRDSQGKRPAVFSTLLSGFAGAGQTLYYRDGTSYGADQPIQLKLLKDVTQKVPIPWDGGRDLTLTSAETSAQDQTYMEESHDTFVFTDTLEGKNQEERGRAVLTRGWDGSSEAGTAMIYLKTADSCHFITRNLVFSGKREGVQKKGRSIAVTSGQLEIHGGSTFRDFYSEGYGGTIHTGQKPLLIKAGQGEKILFDHCVSTGEGGAIETKTGALTLENAGSILARDCSGTYGGWICTDTGGSFTVSNTGNITVENCEATSKSGGAIWTGIFKAEGNEGNITISGCRAKESGGAIQANRDSSSSDTFVIRNTQTGRVTFKDCQAGTGGALYVRRGKMTLTGGETSFEVCRANSGSGGGIRHNEGASLKLSNVTFGGYQRDEEGNYLDAGGKVTTDHALFVTDSDRGCSAVGSGGAIYTGASGGVEIENASPGEMGFYGCMALSSGEGGAIHSQSSAVTVKNTGAGKILFADCTTVSRDGGAISTNEKDVTLINASQGGEILFKGCRQTDEGQVNGAGGAICTHQNKTLTIENKAGQTRVAFLGCTGTRAGGVWTGRFVAQDNQGEILFQDCTATKKQTDGIHQGAGAVYCNSFLLTNAQGGSASFVDCNANTGNGGALCVNNGSNLDGAITLTGTLERPISFVRCRAIQMAGGAIYQVNGAKGLLLTNVSFEDCQAGKEGGAIYTNGTVKASGVLENVKLDGCVKEEERPDKALMSAASGGGLYVNGSGQLVMRNSRIEHCTVTGEKTGALHLCSGARVYFEGDVVVYENYGSTGGVRSSTQKNVALLNPSNSDASTINTLPGGLGEKAKIGIYVAGESASTEPYKSHGFAGQNFGTYGQAQSDNSDYLDAFINDRDPRLVGTANAAGETQHLISWINGQICKLTDGQDVLLFKDANGRTPAVYTSFGKGVQAASGRLYRRDGDLVSEYTGSELKLKLLGDIQVKEKFITYTGSASLVVTSAEASPTSQMASFDTYVFYQPDYAAQGQTDPFASLREEAGGRAILTLDQEKSPLLTVETVGSFGLENLFLDGQGKAVPANGGALQIKKAASLSLQEVTLQNFTARDGGAIYGVEDLTMESSGRVKFKNCCALQSGGAGEHGGGGINTYRGLELTNRGELLFENCTAPNAQGGALNAYGSASGKLDYTHTVEIHNLHSLETGEGATLTFKECSSSTDAGALGVQENNLLIENEGSISFEDCQVSHQDGGAISIDSGRLTVKNGEDASLSFVRCEAMGEGDGYAGAISAGSLSVEENKGSILFKDCKSTGNGGALYVSGRVKEGYSDGKTLLQGVSIEGCASGRLGGAIYAEGDLTLVDGDIKGCTALPENENGSCGAINLSGGKTVSLEGAVLVYDNLDQSGNQKNLVLDQNTNTMINTTGTGLGSEAHVGIYVIDGSSYYGKHGQFEQDFGCYSIQAEGGRENLRNLTNDRNGLYGEACPRKDEKGTDHTETGEHLIRWQSYLCKLTTLERDEQGDLSESSGSLLYTKDATGRLSPAVYDSLKQAFSVATEVGEEGKDEAELYTAQGEAYPLSRPIQVEMLKNMSQPESDRPVVGEGRPLTLTTANESMSENPGFLGGGQGDVFVFYKTSQPGCESVESGQKARARIVRSENGGSMVKVEGALTLRDILLDGGAQAGLSCSQNGGIISGSAKEGGSLTLSGGTVLKNSTTSQEGKGGALYLPAGVAILEEDARIEGCTAAYGGGIYLGADLEIKENAQILACKARESGGALYLEKGGECSLSGGKLLDNRSTGEGAGLFVEEGATLNLSGAPLFAGTYKSASATVTSLGNFREGTVSQKNGGEDYPKPDGSHPQLREDIYLEGYLGVQEGGSEPRPATSLKVTGSLTCGEGSIWVWPQTPEAGEENNHYEQLRQFGVFALPEGVILSEEEKTASMRAFRNAVDDERTGAGEVLYGQFSDEDTQEPRTLIYWSGVSGYRRVILRKVNPSGRALEGATFNVYKGSSSQPYVVKDKEAGTKETLGEYKNDSGETIQPLKSLESGVFWIGTLPYGTYFIKETGAPRDSAYRENQEKWFWLIVDESGVYEGGALKEEGYSQEGSKDKAAILLAASQKSGELKAARQSSTH